MISYGSHCIPTCLTAAYGLSASYVSQGLKYTQSEQNIWKALDKIPDPPTVNKKRPIDFRGKRE